MTKPIAMEVEFHAIGYEVMVIAMATLAVPPVHYLFVWECGSRPQPLLGRQATSQYSYNVTTLESSVRGRDISNDDDAAFSMEDATEIYEEYGMNTHATVTAYPQGDPRIPVNSSAIVWRGNFYLPYHYYEVNFIPLRTGVYHLKVMCIEEDGHSQRALVLSPNTTTPLALTTDEEEFLSNLTHTLTQHHGYADETRSPSVYGQESLTGRYGVALSDRTAFGFLGTSEFADVQDDIDCQRYSYPVNAIGKEFPPSSHPFAQRFLSGWPKHRFRNCKYWYNFSDHRWSQLLRDAFYNDLDANTAVPPLLANPDNDEVLGSVVIIRLFNQSSPEVTQPFSGSCIHRSLPRVPAPSSIRSKRDEHQIRCSVVPVGWASSSMMMSLKVMSEEIARLHHKYPTLDAHTVKLRGQLQSGAFLSPACRATWPVDDVPATVTAGEYEKFVIVDLFDAYGNRHEDTSEVNSIAAYLQLQEGFSCSIPNDKIYPSTSSFTIYLGCTTASSSAQLEVIINGQPIDVSSITPFPINPSTVDRLTTGCAPTPGGSAWSSNTQYNWTCTMKDSYGNPISRDTLVGRAIATVIGASLHMRAMLHSQFLPLQYSNSSNATSRCTEGVVESSGISTTGVHLNGEFLFTPKFTEIGNYSVAVWLRQRRGLLAQYFRNSDFTSLVHRRSLVRHRTFTPIPYTTVAYNDVYGTPGVSLSDDVEATKARSVRMIGSVELRVESTSPVEMRVQLAHPGGFGVRVKVGPLGSTLLMRTGLTPSTGNSSPCDSSLITVINSDEAGADDDGRFEGIITYDDLSTLQTNAGDQPSVSAPDLSAYSGYMLDIVLEYWTEASSEVADDDRLMILWCTSTSNCTDSSSWQAIPSLCAFYPTNVAAFAAAASPVDIIPLVTIL